MSNIGRDKVRNRADTGRIIKAGTFILHGIEQRKLKGYGHVSRIEEGRQRNWRTAGQNGRNDPSHLRSHM